MYFKTGNYPPEGQVWQRRREPALGERPYGEDDVGDLYPRAQEQDKLVLPVRKSAKKLKKLRISTTEAPEAKDSAEYSVSR